MVSDKHFWSDLGIALGGCLGIILLVLLGVGVWFGITYGITYLTIWVFSGFGYLIPFWPTFGAIILIQFVLGILGKRAS